MGPLSAAGGGRDGTVAEGELTGRSVNRDGDGEVEHGTAFADCRASCLRGASRGGQDLGLELEELTHEAEVGGDDAAALLDELKGLVQLHAVGAHEVGEADGGRAGDAGLTMHEHTTPVVSHRIWLERKTKKNRERKIRITAKQPKVITHKWIRLHY